MDAGKLDRRIKILASVVQQDETGQPIAVESELATVWAYRMEQRLGEVFTAGADRPADTLVWRIRWRDDVTRDMVIRYGSERYEVQAVREEGRREWLDLIVSKTGASV